MEAEAYRAAMRREPQRSTHFGFRVRTRLPGRARARLPELLPPGRAHSAPNFAGGANLIAEAQVNYVVECLDLLHASGARELEVRADATVRWNHDVDAQLEHLLWSHPGSHSYYQNRAGRNYLSWPFRLVDCWHATRRPDVNDLELRA